MQKFVPHLSRYIGSTPLRDFVQELLLVQPAAVTKKASLLALKMSDRILNDSNNIYLKSI